MNSRQRRENKMKNRKFNQLYKLSGLFIIIGFLICALNYEITTDTPEGCVLWMAEFFAVTLLLGYLGFELYIWLHRKKFTVIGKRSILFGIVASLIIGAATGAVGQAIYSLEMQEYTEYDTIDTESKKTNVCFLMDYSSSMNSVHDNCVDAAKAVIDELDENVSFQFAAFANILIDEKNHASEMLPATDSNKKVLKDFIDSVFLYGYGTDFNIPLDFAVSSLNDNKANDTRSVIVMLTDCEATVEQSVIDNVKKNNCELYVLTYFNGTSTFDNLTPNADEVFHLDPGSTGNDAIKQVTEALKKAVNGSDTVEVTKTKLAMSENLILGRGESSFMRIIVRALVYGIICAAAGFIYYGFEDPKKLLINFLFGVLAAVVSIVAVTIGLLVLLVGMTDFTKFIITEENQNV